MRIPHLVPISFPPRGAHEKISSTCAKIPTILSTFFSQEKSGQKKRKRAFMTGACGGLHASQGDTGRLRSGAALRRLRSGAALRRLRSGAALRRLRPRRFHRLSGAQQTLRCGCGSCSAARHSATRRARPMKATAPPLRKA
jgi:hypothetical protein